MAETMKDARIQALVREGRARVSTHGYDELPGDGLFADEIVDAVASAVLIEDDPELAKGPRVLVLHRVAGEAPVHVVWGIPKGHTPPAALITVYRPDPDRWAADFRRRKP